MPLNEEPLINSTIVSWAEMQWLMMPYMGGPPTQPVDIVNFKFSEKLTPGDVKAAGIVKRGTTVGEYTCDGGFTLLLEQHILFVQSLIAAAALLQCPIGAVQFGVFCNWKLKLGHPISSVELRGCRIIERTFDSSPSPDASQIDTPLNVTKVLVNGVSLADTPGP